MFNKKKNPKNSDKTEGPQSEQNTATIDWLFSKNGKTSSTSD